MPKHALLGDSLLEPRFEEHFLADMVRQALGRPVEQITVSALQGDASTRRYFRLALSAAGQAPQGETLILMQLEQPEPGGETDFIRVLKFLESSGLPVPELIHYDAGRGLLLLQDCGDLTLEAHLQSLDGESLRKSYIQAVHLLAEMQTRATRNIRSDCPAYHLRFDIEKLMWEMDFMLEHFIEGLRHIPLNGPVRQTLRNCLTGLCQTLADQPLWFTHRDYHSRNLMVHDGRLILLDFQDARMGPSQYDLASLLRDSYVLLPDDLVWELVDLFLQKQQELGNPPVDHEDYLRIFDFMSIQRNLKAVGTFAFQKQMKGTERYLPYIAPTLNYVKEALQRRPELKSLSSALTEILPELRS